MTSIASIPPVSSAIAPSVSANATLSLVPPASTSLVPTSTTQVVPPSSASTVSITPTIETSVLASTSLSTASSTRPVISSTVMTTSTPTVIVDEPSTAWNPPPRRTISLDDPTTTVVPPLLPTSRTRTRGTQLTSTLTSMTPVVSDTTTLETATTTTPLETTTETTFSTTGTLTATTLPTFENDQTLPVTPSSNQNGSPSSPSFFTSNMPAIVGTVACVLVAMFAIGFLVYKRKQGPIKKRDNIFHQDTASSSSFTSEFPSPLLPLSADSVNASHMNIKPTPSPQHHVMILSASQSTGPLQQQSHTAPTPLQQSHTAHPPLSHSPYPLSIFSGQQSMAKTPVSVMVQQESMESSFKFNQSRGTLDSTWLEGMEERRQKMHSLYSENSVFIVEESTPSMTCSKMPTESHVSSHSWVAREYSDASMNGSSWTSK